MSLSFGKCLAMNKTIAFEKSYTFNVPTEWAAFML